MAADDGWMVDFVKDVLAHWPFDDDELMSHAVRMKWRCRGRLAELKLVMLAALTSVWMYPVARAFLNLGSVLNCFERFLFGVFMQSLMLWDSGEEWLLDG